MTHSGHSGRCGLHLANLLGNLDCALGHAEMQPLDHAAIDHDHPLLRILGLLERSDDLARPGDFLLGRGEDLVAGSYLAWMD